MKKLIVTVFALIVIPAAQAQQRQNLQQSQQCGAACEFVIAPVCDAELPAPLSTQLETAAPLLDLSSKIRACLRQNPRLGDLDALTTQMRALGHWGGGLADCQPIAELEAEWKACLDSQNYFFDPMTLRFALTSSTALNPPPSGPRRDHTFSRLLTMSLLEVTNLERR